MMTTSKGTLLATFWRDTTTLGGGLFYIVLIVLTLFLREIKLFEDLLWGFLITAIVVVGIRTFYFKSRPDKQTYHTFIERIDAASFPSWHTARALFLALVLGDFLADVFVRIFLLLVAALVFYSRIYLKKHDRADVIGGIVLGAITYGIIVSI